jgi:hypothetical protein
MTGVLKSLFGGSSAEQKSTTTQTNYTDPNLSGLAPDLAATLRTLLGSFGTQAQNAGDPSTATPTPQAGMTGNETNLINTIQGQVGPGTDSAAYIRDVLGGKYMPGQDGANPYFDAAVRAAQRPTLEGLTETLTRSLPGRFTAAGQLIQPNTGDQGGSSAFDRAAAIATRGVSNAVGDIATNMGNTAYNSERTNQNVAAGLDQQQVDQTIKALQASALPRLIQQNGLDQGLALFQEQTKNLLDILKTLGAVQAPTLAANTTSTGKSSTEKGIIPGLFPNGLGGGGGPSGE